MSSQLKAATLKSFLDTSVVTKLQLGTSLLQDYLRRTIVQKWYINNYVRMEHFRHSLIIWINLYFESADPNHKTFGDAWKLYSEGFGREAKNAVSALTTMEADGFSFAKAEDKQDCRAKLQDFIYSMALQFEEMFTDMGADPTHCTRVRKTLKIPTDAAERDEQLLRFASVFRNEKVCRSLCSISNLFAATLTHKRKFDAIAAATTTGKTVSKLENIQEAVGEAVKDPAAITCKTCSSMGDAVIASALDSSWKFHSLDTVHVPISNALKIECEIHPSERALANRSSASS
jgi:transcription termination factor NusB